jgi:hypothetical protein
MSISPVSNVNAVYGSQNVQNQTPTPNKPSPSQTTDTVQLSQAALQHLQSSGDKDHDGDSH